MNELEHIIYAVFQNFACEVEKLMGIYPNVPGLGRAATTDSQP